MATYDKSKSSNLFFKLIYNILNTFGFYYIGDDLDAQHSSNSETINDN